MKYKHKLTIGDSLDIAYPVHGRIKTEGAQLEMAEVYRKAEAFDAILKKYDEALSEGHMADEVCNIIQEYEKRTDE